MVGRSDRGRYLAACSGDRAAFEELARHHQEFVYRRALSATGGRRSDAEDVAHQAWLKFSEHLRRVQDGTTTPLNLVHERSLRSWLSRVVSNAANDMYRSQRRIDWGELEDSDLVYFPEPGERLEREHQRRSVWSAFEKLSEGCRRLLMLLLEDPPLEYREIAEQLDKPVGSIGPTRQRCLGQLRNALGPR